MTCPSFTIATLALTQLPIAQLLLGFLSSRDVVLAWAGCCSEMRHILRHVLLPSNLSPPSGTVYLRDGGAVRSLAAFLRTHQIASMAVRELIVSHGRCKTVHKLPTVDLASVCSAAASGGAQRLVLMGRLSGVDQALRALPSGGRQRTLQEVDLRWCTGLTGSSFRALLALRLRSLRLECCTSGLTERDLVRCLAPRNTPYLLARLRCLHLTNCRALTDRVIQALLACSQQLVHLGLCRCPHVTDQGICLAVQRTTLLKSLKVCNCERCSLAVIPAILSLSAPNIRCLEIEVNV